MTAGSVSAPLIIPLQRHGAKNRIDTDTRVSIHSDTPGVLVFYTLDGSKPVEVQRGAAGGSRKYREPILLPAGRVTVKAFATTRAEDGGNSSVGSTFPEKSSGVSIRQRQPNQFPPMLPRSLPNQLSSTQTSRILRDTNFLWCPQCLSLRPSDPLARFCSQCGATVPTVSDRRLPPAEGGQMVHCVSCSSLVPINTQTCVICDASTNYLLTPQSSLRLQGHVICIFCGRGNPGHISNCLTCESPLQPSCSSPSSKKMRLMTPRVMEDVCADSRMLSCSRCKRLNRSDARFCDWCGCKPNHAVSCVTCWRCGASGHPYAVYCAACGVFLKAPAHSTSCCDVTRPEGGAASNQASPLTSLGATWQAMPSPDPIPSVKLAPPTVDRHTQTVGLYYPSATELRKQEQQRALSLKTEKVPRDRQPPLTAISPGRGYWRKQLDHVCAHLRSYTQNNTSFRALLGEPRLGRMVSAVIQEDGYEVTLTISFVLAAGEEKQVGPEGGVASTDQTLSSVTERTVTSRRQKRDRPTGLKGTPEPGPAPKPPVSDSLLVELRPGGGRVRILQQLLDQGADPCCCGSDGQHALAVAVLNGHHDVLPVLLQRGADVNQQSGPMKNTALHEAAARGSAGLQSADILLSCNAGTKQRNAAGETAYDVAVGSGCDAMVSLLAGRTGRDILDKLGRRNRDAF
ncbi:double zinc ribbon and ankyrin repeat-containing protein 1 [Aulostomus maculatus]